MPTWMWTKRKKWTTVIFIVLFVVLFFVFSIDSAVSFSHIDVNKKDIVVGDQLVATAYVTDWKSAKIITVFLDDEMVTTCVPGPTCALTLVTMPFDIGEHTYTFVATDKKGKTKKMGGSFTVKTDLPEVVNLTTNGNQIAVGGAWFVKLDAKSESPITAAKLSVDGVLVQYCLTVPCIGYVGPFTDGDIGEHTYTFEVTNQTGKKISPGGLFAVIPNKENGKTTVSLPDIESIKLSKKDVPAGEATTIDITAKDDKGIVVILVYIDGKYVGGCDKKVPCSVKTQVFGEGDIGPHNYKIIVINNDGKKTEADGSFWVVPKKKDIAPAQNAAPTNPAPASSAPANQPQNKTAPGNQPAPAQPAPPQPATPTSTGAKSAAAEPTDTQKKISTPEIEYVTTQGNQLFVGETFVAKVFAKDEAGIFSILGYIDDKLVSTCEKIVVCPLKKGPLADSDIGGHSYKYIVRNIFGKTIETSGMFVVSAKANATPSAELGDKSAVTPTSTPGSTPKPSEPVWIDTDGGINESVVGQCTTNVKGARYQKFVEDYCLDKKTLNEYYVDGKTNTCLVKQITCAGVCYEGMCHKPGTRPGAGYTPPAEPPSRPGAGYTPPTEPPSRPGAGYTPPAEPPSRPGAGYEPPSRPGASYLPPAEPPSRQGASYTPPAETEEPPSREGAAYTPSSR